MEIYDGTQLKNLQHWALAIWAGEYEPDLICYSGDPFD